MNTPSLPEPGLPAPQFSPPIVTPAVIVQPGMPLGNVSHVPVRRDVPAFYFDGGAGNYLGTSILAFLVTVLTLGIALPFAMVLVLRWRAKHTFIEGRRLMFTGTGMGLFGNWIKWWFLTIITLGIYSFWVVPRLVKWQVEHQAFDPRG